MLSIKNGLISFCEFAIMNNVRFIRVTEEEIMDLCTAGSLDKKFILDLYMSAFPEEERKPFSLIERKAVMGEMEILLIRENGKRAGFAITALQDDLVLLDYFAVAPEYRGQGIGSDALQMLLALYSERQFYLEIECPDETAPNQPDRLRRKAFYLQNGMLETEIRIELFGVEMELLCSQPGLKYEQCERLYRSLVGPMYHKHVRRIG